MKQLLKCLMVFRDERKKLCATITNDGSIGDEQAKILVENLRELEDLTIAALALEGEEK